jgi:hypothetical protein
MKIDPCVKLFYGGKNVVVATQAEKTALRGGAPALCSTGLNSSLGRMNFAELNEHLRAAGFHPRSYQVGEGWR